MSAFPSASSGNPNDITIVIPGRNCATTLPHCLSALAPFVESGRVKEIIFVNDASSDESQTIAEKRGARVLWCPGKGPGAARNLGWRAANTPLIWFIDADCVPELEALQLLEATKAAVGAKAIGGSYANARNDSLVARLIHEEMVIRHRSIGTTSNFAITANLLCERSVLEHLGGFDESFKLAQDLDLAYRIVDAGHVLGFEAASKVAHFHETELFRYLKKQARQGYWRMQLYKKHPKRASGDKYSGIVDYAQPPLAMLTLSSLLGTSVVKVGKLVAPRLPFLAPRLPFVAPRFLSVAPRSFLTFSATGTLSAVIFLQLPMASQLAKSSMSDALAYIPFGTLRAGARGLGMSAGLFAILTNRGNPRKSQLNRTEDEAT